MTEQLVVKQDETEMADGIERHASEACLTGSKAREEKRTPRLPIDQSRDEGDLMLSSAKPWDQHPEDTSRATVILPVYA